MGRCLLVMRHAKSSWSGGFSDHERPLNTRGRAAAPFMAGTLLRRGLIPNHVAVSDAERTRETLTRMVATWAQEPPTDLRADLYLPDLTTWLRIAREAPPQAERLLVLSHNPVSEDAVEHLTGVSVTMRTAAVAVIDVGDTPWAALGAARGAARLIDVLVPEPMDD